MYRQNAANYMQTLENLSYVAKKVEQIISENQYPQITDALKSSLRTKEFLSLYSLQELVVRITQLFQCICESDYVDYNIYDQVKQYLDTLLYTYAGTKNFNEMRLNECKKIPNKIFSFAHEYDGKLEFKAISAYNGVNLYIKKIFDFIINEEQDSLSFEFQNEQVYKYDYRYEFKNIESLKEFLKKYYLYSQKSENFL